MNPFSDDFVDRFICGKVWFCKDKYGEVQRLLQTQIKGKDTYIYQGTVDPERHPSLCSLFPNKTIAPLKHKQYFYLNDCAKFLKIEKEKLIEMMLVHNLLARTTFPKYKVYVATEKGKVFSKNIAEKNGKMWDAVKLGKFLKLL